MKRLFLLLAIICLIVVGCLAVLTGCSTTDEDIAIVHQDEILSRYGDAFINVGEVGGKYVRKYLIDTRIRGRHSLGLYVAIGDAIEYTIDSSEIGNNHELVINANSTGEYHYVLDSASGRTIQRASSPGVVELDVKETESPTISLTITIHNLISRVDSRDMPTYRYGISEEPAFRNVGVYNVLECMNFRVYVPSRDYSKINNAEKAMNWWRNALLLMDEVLGLSIFQDDFSPMNLYFSDEATEASFDPMDNSIFLPSEYISTIVDYDLLTNGNNGKLLEVLDVIAKEKLAFTNAFSDTFLKDAIDVILARLTYVSMVDEFSANLNELHKEYTSAGNIEQILKGEFENDTERYSALFMHLYYNTTREIVYLALEETNKNKYTDSLLIARVADLMQENLIPLADKLDISLYGTAIEIMSTYPTHYFVSNYLTFGTMQRPAQLGLTVKMGEVSKFDFAGAMAGEGEWQISEIVGSEGRWSKEESTGLYVYSPSAKLLKDTFTLIVTQGDVSCKLYGNINVDITVCNNAIYDKVGFKTLDEAIKGVKDLGVTQSIALDYAGIEKEEQESEEKRFVVSTGSIEVPEDGYYTLYLKSSGLCSVNFGVKDYSTEIFRNSLTVSNYTNELSYEVKLQKGFTYIFTIYDLFNRGSGFAALGIKAPSSDVIKDVNKDFLVYTGLLRNDIVKYTNEQKYAEMYSMQRQEYMPVNSYKIAQITNIPSYEIGYESEVIEKGSIVSFVLPFDQSLVDYAKIDTIGMENVTMKVYGGAPSYSTLLAEVDYLHDENVVLFDQMTLQSLKFEFTSKDEYKLFIMGLEVGKSISSMTIIPSTSTQIEYIGEWTSSSNYIAINGKLAVTQSEDAIFSYSFNGNEISIYATKGADFGSAKVTIDGQEKESIDFRSETGKVQCSQLVYTAKLSDGDHVIQITPNSEDPINVDYLAVTSFGDTKTKNDFSKLWYISFIPGLVLIAGIVFIIMDFKEKKKKKEQLSA